MSAIGALVPRLLGGTVVTESVFSWPGLGRLALEAAEGRDYPLITGLTVVVAAIAVATSLLVDLALHAHRSADQARMTRLGYAALATLVADRAARDPWPASLDDRT